MSAEENPQIESTNIQDMGRKRHNSRLSIKLQERKSVMPKQERQIKCRDCGGLKQKVQKSKKTSG